MNAKHMEIEPQVQLNLLVNTEHVVRISASLQFNLANCIFKIKYDTREFVLQQM